ncbi:MAG: hypothetical protein H5U02_14690 [Clostridia bacterium]|nr:hypothetical protein [Clostridia bacterium]
MVDWIQLHNKVKGAANLQLLNSSQRAAFFSIQEAVRYANRINLYGESGAGKTFLGWVLAQELGALYLPSPFSQAQKAELIVVDDAPSTRTESRVVYDYALEFASSVVLLTREPIDDQIIRLRLSLTSEDLVFVGNTLRGFGGPLRIVAALEPGLLWNYFLVLAKGGGECAPKGYST